MNYYLNTWTEPQQYIMVHCRRAICQSVLLLRKLIGHMKPSRVELYLSKSFPLYIVLIRHYNQCSVYGAGLRFGDPSSRAYSM